MSRSSRSKCLLLLVAASAAWQAQSHAHTHDNPHDGPHADHAAHGAQHGAQSSAGRASPEAPAGVSVNDCWIRAMPAGLPSAGYFRIENTSNSPVALVGAEAQGFGKVMLHTHLDTGGMSRMAHVDKVDLPPGGGFDFAPGGHHLMLEQPAGDLAIGSTRSLMLRFEGGRALTVQCELRPPSAMGH